MTIFMTRRAPLKLIFITITIVLSFMCGALLQAFAAGEEQGSTDETVSGLPSVIAHPEVSATSSSPTAAGAVRLSSLAGGMETVDVCPGDTLWDIAIAHLPKDESVRSYIKKIKKANDLQSSDLRAGQILILP